MAQKYILNVPAAIEHLLPLAQHHRAEAVVDIQHHGADLRVQRQKLCQKGLLQLEHGGDRHQHHHDLPCGKAPAHQHMPQPAAAAALVIDLYFKLRQQLPYADNNFVCKLILDHALVHRHDGVAARLVDAGDHPPVPIQAEGGVDLVPVMQGIVHAHDLLHMAEAAQQGDLSFLFMQKLLGIAHVLQLAAAAGAALGTAVFFALFHFQ